jgi:two-component system, NarL family, sensor kinase
MFRNEILKAQIEMQEQTFLSISQEIHDNLGQILALIRLNISTIKPCDPASTANKITSSKELLDQAIEDLRDLSKRLNFDFINQKRLSESIIFHLNLIKKGGQLETSFEKEGIERPLDSDIKIIVIRIIQEALNNIIKHAAAKTITVLLFYLPEKSILTIKDNGKGFKQKDRFKGMGIQSMIRRARMINADFSIKSLPEGGTIIRLVIPNITNPKNHEI